MKTAKTARVIISAHLADDMANAGVAALHDAACAIYDMQGAIADGTQAGTCKVEAILQLQEVLMFIDRQVRKLDSTL